MHEFSEEIIRAIEEFATEGIQITDAKGNYIFCNQAFAAITGVPVQQRLGHSIWDGQQNGACAAVLKTGHPVYGYMYSPQEREGVVLVVNAAPILNKNGEMVGVITVFNDQANYIKLVQALKEKEGELQQLKKKIGQVDRSSHTFRDLIGEHLSFRSCVDRAVQAAKGDASVLITGESGTGKELFAHAIHGYGARAESPFIRVNCPAIPSTLMESELFGYEKGAFTGAQKEKPGKFELAQHGSIFLDEIGDLDIILQAKLLRVLQEREVERLGGTKTIPLDVRVIAATNQDLWEEIRQGKFRQDLYYRLNVIHIEIPPLRQRRTDIPLLLEQMLKKHSGGRIPCSISKDAMKIFMDYDWPGNVRELENAAERLLLYRNGPIVHQDDALYVLGDRETGSSFWHLSEMSLAEMEKLMIQNALERRGTSLEEKKQVAAELGISLSTLYEKIRKYAINGRQNSGQSSKDKPAL
ncbi:MAG: sigma-54 interaction domain-containing protein [Lawsonibacter sp.]